MYKPPTPRCRDESGPGAYKLGPGAQASTPKPPRGQQCRGPALPYGLDEAWTLLGRAVRLVAAEDLHASLQVEERGAPAQDGARVAVLHIA